MNKDLQTATTIAELLDNKFEVFGIRFGIDPILGLIPGGGDLVGFILALYIVLIGVRMELPRPKIYRMLVNIALDFGIGLLPVLGDIADFAFKSNMMNLEILKKHAAGSAIDGEIVSR